MDIVTRLRDSANESWPYAQAASNTGKPESDNNYGRAHVTMNEAADEICRLRLEVEHQRNEVDRLRGENLCLSMQAQIAESHFKDIVILCSLPKISLTKAAIRAAEGARE